MQYAKKRLIKAVLFFHMACLIFALCSACVRHLNKKGQLELERISEPEKESQKIRRYRYTNRGRDEKYKLTSFVIPDTVTYIGYCAFSGNLLTSIIIPKGVTYIGDSAFLYNDLQSIVIPNRVIYIGEEAFRGNSLSNVIIPDSVAYLGEEAFSFNKLTNVKLSKNIYKIDAGTFKFNKLSAITIPNGITEIGDEAFEYNKLQSIIIPKSVTKIGAAAFKGNELTSILMHEGLRSIGREAFLWSYRSTEITIPDSVRVIGEQAFGYSTLRRIKIGAGVSFEWPDFAIDNHRHEKTHTFGDYGESFIQAYDFNNRQAGTYTQNETTGHWSYNGVQLPIEPAGYIRIPDGVVVIEKGAYSGNFWPIDGAAIVVEIPPSVRVIGNRAFSYNLFPVVEIPDGVTVIGEGAFGNCRVEKLTLPDSLTSIGNKAFEDNWLKEIVIPPKITSLEDGVFNENSIIKITIGGNVEFFGNVYTEIAPHSDHGYVMITATFGYYGDEFKRDYEKNNRAAGVYTYDSDTEIWIYDKQ
jgi:hypothetical protein